MVLNKTTHSSLTLAFLTHSQSVVIYNIIQRNNIRHVFQFFCVFADDSCLTGSLVFVNHSVLQHLPRPKKQVTVSEQSLMSHSPHNRCYAS